MVRERPRPPDGPPSKSATHSYLLQVRGHAMAQVLEAVVPALDRLLAEKTAQVRSRKMEELVDFITGQLVVPSVVDTQMAQRLAARHARVLNEFGFATASALADANYDADDHCDVAVRS